MIDILSASVQWDKVGIVLGIIAALAVLFAVLILIVTKVCKITEDEKVVKILEHLAGANCGGCGHSGCEGFAQCLACGKASLDDCKVTSDEEKRRKEDNSENSGHRVCRFGTDRRSRQMRGRRRRRGQIRVRRQRRLSVSQPISRRLQDMRHRVPRRRLLHGGVPCRRDKARKRGRESGQDAVHILRSVYARMPALGDRAHPRFGKGLLRLLHALQRQGNDVFLRQRLYRMRALRASLPRKGDNDERQPSRIRLFEMRRLHEMPRKVPAAHNQTDVINVGNERPSVMCGRSFFFSTIVISKNICRIPPKGRYPALPKALFRASLLPA